MARLTPGRSRARGYTVIEVLVAISLLIIASSGIAALQKITVQGNGHARETATASQLARTWVERLRTDATSWNYSTASGVASDINQTTWLGNVDTQPMTWFVPTAAALGSPGFDLQGSDVAVGDLDRAFFCTHVRLAWMFPQEVIRAEVRVLWQRPQAPGNFPAGGPCAATQVVANFDNPLMSPLASYNFVYVTSSILRNKPALQ